MPITAATNKVGLALPLLRSQGGYFASKSGVEFAWGCLMLVMFTPVGGRPMRRAFGSGLADLLFDPTLTPGTDDPTVLMVAQDAAARHCTHATVRAVTTRQTGNRTGVRVSFTPAGETPSPGDPIDSRRAGVVRELASRYGR